MGSAIGNIGDMAQKPMDELTGPQQAGKGIMGALGGGLKGLGQRQQQPQQPNMPGPMPMLPQAPQYDFSQIQKRSPFYGG